MGQVDGRKEDVLTRGGLPLRNRWSACKGNQPQEAMKLTMHENDAPKNDVQYVLIIH